MRVMVIGDFGTGGAPIQEAPDSGRFGDSKWGIFD
jgi:hypothetical protein